MSGWLGRLKAGLGRSAGAIGGGIGDIFVKRKLDDQALEELEELLIRADLGVTVAARLSAGLAKSRFGQDVTPEEVRGELAQMVAEILEPVALPLELDASRRPHVILVVGVNGTGKTTTIGKLAAGFAGGGKTGTLVAGDTFRAAAIEQLEIWGQRSGQAVLAREPGADAAGLAFDAFNQARAAGNDFLMIDTAGRLHNKANLMAELGKIVRVVQKIDESAPHSVLLVLDATTGQNAHSQVEAFRDLCNVTGLVMTKLDGTAKGGVLIGLAERFGLPIHAVGVGEGIDDLQSFEALSFARALVGLED